MSGTRGEQERGYEFIEKGRYTSEDFARRERERMWSNVWQLAGLCIDVDAPGRYFTYSLGQNAILVVRGEDKVRAFHNACRHRGRALCEPGSGRLPSIKCPYHQWEWALDGTLENIPCRSAFSQITDSSDYGLVEIACETWGGFVWVHFGAAPMPLADFLGGMGQRISAYGLESYSLRTDQTVELDCNWKVAVDASNESYHIPAVHPELLQVYDERHLSGLSVSGDHAMESARFAVPSSGRSDRDHLNDWMKQLVVEAGLTPSHFEGRATEVRGAIQRSLRARVDEFDLSNLDDDQLTDYCSYFFFPNVHMNIQGLNLNISRCRPHPTSPSRMYLDQMTFTRLPKASPRPSRPAHAQFRHGEGSLGFVTDQDTYNYLRVQRGLESPSFERVVVGDLERRIRHMHRVLDDYMADPDPRPKRVDPLKSD